MKKILVLVLFIMSVHAFGQKKKSLNGEWLFSLDPVRAGEKYGWFLPSFSPRGWDKVSVPHSYSVDPRYHNFTGNAWYIKSFDQSPPGDGMRALLRFDAVFYRTKVWLNGKLLGEHEGGYTPFTFDVTDILREKNILAVRADNSWDTTTIPGAKPKVDFEGSSSSQVFPWINYGGITRPVSLEIRPEVYTEKVRINATPDLARKSARIVIDSWITNASPGAVDPTASAVSIYVKGRKVPVKFKSSAVAVAPGKSAQIRSEGIITKDVLLWSFDDPKLYTAEIVVGKDTLKKDFGIRSVEVRGTSLLLNGEPVRMGGCNRPLDYPGFGSIDPPQVLQQDLTLIKNGSMELSRLSHYPVSEALLDWADKNGMLLIGEAGNWQMTPSQMADPRMRAKFESQFREMIERDWNHPSVIAWSVGNEYQSQTDEGKAWTRDMANFARNLDPSRLVTFASMIVFRESIKSAQDEASQYVDFVSANIYGNQLENLQRIHKLYPDKPVYVSEFGWRADQVKTEEDREKQLLRAVEDFRKLEYVIGASVWTFNDYKSIFPGTNVNGYRPWGLVSPERELRGMYHLWQKEFSPALMDVTRNGTTLLVTVTARKDFPSYVLRNYSVRAGNRNYPLGILKPGESVKVSVPDDGQGQLKQIELLKPGNFVILRQDINPNGIIENK